MCRFPKLYPPKHIYVSTIIREKENIFKLLLQNLEINLVTSTHRQLIFKLASHYLIFSNVLTWFSERFQNGEIYIKLMNFIPRKFN